MDNKSKVEKEYDCYIPVIMDLKGPSMRLGEMENSHEVSLKAGQEFRISTDAKLLGDSHIISCDNEDLAQNVIVGDKLLMEYGRVALTIRR